MRRPAFQAIIEALHQQMQQHLAAEKAAAAAASAVAAKGVSPFGTLSTLMKVWVAHVLITGVRYMPGDSTREHESLDRGFSLCPS